MNDGLSAKELHLIQLIAEDSQSQRRLAEKTGFSLGMTNILLKRLISKGYIKVVHLNGRTLRYMLTPQGFKEKLRRTHSYLRESIRRIRAFQRALSDLLDRELPGVARLYVLGSGEVFEMTCELLEDAGIEYQRASVETFSELVRASSSKASVAMPEQGRILVLSAQPDLLPEDVAGASDAAGRIRCLDVAALVS